MPSEPDPPQLQQLEEEIKRLRDFSELTSDWFWEQDAELRFTRFYGMSPQLLRRKQSDFFGRRRWEMPISGLSDQTLAEHIHCCEQRLPFRDFEYNVTGLDNLLQRYSVSGRPMFNDQNEFIGYRGVGRNITELWEAEQAVHESERKLSQIIAGNAVPLFVINRDHQVTHWNRACEKLTNIPAEQIIGSTDAWRGFYRSRRPALADLVVDGASIEQIRTYYGDTLNASSLIPGAFEAEDFFPDMVGGGCWLFFTAAPLLSSDGKTVAAIETLQDISPRKQAEKAERHHLQELQQAHSELQNTMDQLIQAKKLAALGRLVAGVAHELNTPIGNALMATTVLETHLQEIDHACDNQTLSHKQLQSFRQDCHQVLELLHLNLKRSGSLINRFRALADDQRHDDFCSYHPHALIKEQLQLFGKPIAERNIHVSNRVSEDVQMHGYPQALSQIIAILIENSLIHGLTSGGHISLDATIGAHHLQLQYRDDGRGMDSAGCANAFDPFFSTRFGQGESGLGLYRAYNLITVVLGGQVDLHSAVDQGVQLVMELPLKAPQQPKASQ